MLKWFGNERFYAFGYSTAGVLAAQCQEADLGRGLWPWYSTVLEYRIEFKQKIADWKKKS